MFQIYTDHFRRSDLPSTYLELFGVFYAAYHTIKKNIGGLLHPPTVHLIFPVARVFITTTSEGSGDIESDPDRGEIALNIMKSTDIPSYSAKHPAAKGKYKTTDNTSGKLQIIRIHGSPSLESD